MPEHPEIGETVRLRAQQVAARGLADEPLGKARPTHSSVREARGPKASNGPTRRARSTVPRLPYSPSPRGEPPPRPKRRPTANRPSLRGRADWERCRYGARHRRSRQAFARSRRAGRASDSGRPRESVQRVRGRARRASTRSSRARSERKVLLGARARNPFGAGIAAAMTGIEHHDRSPGRRASVSLTSPTRRSKLDPDHARARLADQRLLLLLIGDAGCRLLAAQGGGREHDAGDADRRARRRSRPHGPWCHEVTLSCGTWLTCNYCWISAVPAAPVAVAALARGC